MKEGSFNLSSKDINFIEEREVKITALNKALVEGEESGIADYFLESFLEEIEQEINKP